MCERCAKQMEKDLNELLPKGVKVEVQIKQGGLKEILELVKEKAEDELEKDGYTILPTGEEKVLKKLAPELLIAFSGKYEVYQDGDDDMIIISSEKGRAAILSDIDGAIVKTAQQLTEWQTLSNAIRQATKH